MTKPLPVGSSSVYVMFPQPKTNVDWFRSDQPLILFFQNVEMTFVCHLFSSRYVEAEPSWAKQLEGEMTLGRKRVTFRFLVFVHLHSLLLLLTPPPHHHNGRKEDFRFLQKFIFKLAREPSLSLLTIFFIEAHFCSLDSNDQQ